MQAGVLGIAAVGALAASGCGGGGSDTTSAGATGASGASGATPLSQGEFVSQADAACKQVNDKIQALKAPSSSDAPTIAAYATQYLDIVNPAYAQLAAINPPSDLQAKYNQFLSSLKAGIGNLGDLKSAAEAGNVQQVRALAAKNKDTSRATDSLARSLGLAECTKNVQPQG